MNIQKIPLEVECYSGYKEAETPRSFVLGGLNLTVLAILKTWKEESVNKGQARKTFFKIRANDAKIYILSHNELTDEWLLEREEKK